MLQLSLAARVQAHLVGTWQEQLAGTFVKSYYLLLSSLLLLLLSFIISIIIAITIIIKCC